MKHDEEKIEEIIRPHTSVSGGINPWKFKRCTPEPQELEKLQEDIVNIMKQYAEHMVQQERERIVKIANENFSRSTQPLYAHVDYAKLINGIKQE